MSPTHPSSGKSIFAEGDETIEVDTNTSESAEPSEVTMDDLYFALSNHRRRFVLDYLTRVTDNEVLRTLSAELAAYENQIPTNQTSAVQRKRAYVALHQNHLPKLDELGIIHYDRSRGNATLADGIDELNIYLEATRANDIPWAHFYLGLGGMALMLVMATGLSLPPFDRLSTLTIAVIIALTFTLVAVIHVVRTAQSRLNFGVDT